MKHKMIKIYDYFIVIIILLSIITTVIQSINEYRDSNILMLFDRFVLTIFLLDLIKNMYTSYSKNSFRGLFSYMMSYIGFVDILSIIPSLIVGTDMTSIRVFRLMRLFRLMKLTKYLSGIDLIINVINKNRGKLLISLIFIFMMFTFSSILMYSVEYEAQPEVFSSIPKTAWWAIATMTTVGYGDMYPITSIGKVVAGFVSIVSLFIFAIPTSILASGFVEISSIKVKEESNDTDIYDISQMD